MSAYPSHQFRLYSFKGKIVTWRKKEKKKGNRTAQSEKTLFSTYRHNSDSVCKNCVFDPFLYIRRNTPPSPVEQCHVERRQFNYSSRALLRSAKGRLPVSCRAVPCSTVPSLSIQRRSQMRQSYILYTRSQKESIPFVAGGDSQQSCLGEVEWTCCLDDCQYKKYHLLNSYFQCEFIVVTLLLQ